MLDYDDYDPPIEIFEDEAVFWTRPRIIYAVIAILIIVTLMALILWPALSLWLNPPPPPPPTEALPRV
jgi:hypothetical protein